MSGASESNVQSRTRLAAQAKRPWPWRLWRNNRGVFTNPAGQPVRCGLANDSKVLGDRLKSGDLIGWRTVLITPDMVGRCIAQFVSVECKPENWREPPPGTIDKHVIAQRAWADLVNREGGYAVFIARPEDL
jgi:hypothetical protein